MITTEFEKLDFHDASIDSINREEKNISIRFSGALLRKEHSNSDGDNWKIDQGILCLFSVSSEESIFWYGNQEAKPHPEPEFPLDEITILEFDGSIFKFSGFLRGEPWMTWNVTAKSFEVEIIEKSNYVGRD